MVKQSALTHFARPTITSFKQRTTADCSQVNARKSANNHVIQSMPAKKAPAKKATVKKAPDKKVAPKKPVATAKKAK